MPWRTWIVGSLLLNIGPLYSQTLSQWNDPSPHKVQFVTVEKDVRLEVLDWGGHGKPLVLLAGGGNTAHIFDDFAPKLTGRYHVFGITRRGFGASGFSPTTDPADRLGEDVLTVIDVLRLQNPVLVGHSIAGAELSSIANREPKRIAAAIYLEAAYSYAFDNGKGTNIMAAQSLQAPQPPAPSGPDLASFSALQRYYERVNGYRLPESELRQQFKANSDGSVGKSRDNRGGALLMSLITGSTKYTAIPVPALVIFANPHNLGTWVEDSTDPSVRAAAKAYSLALTPLTEKQERSVENGVPTARVITLANAQHFVFLSNEADVLRALRLFLSNLQRHR